MFILTIHIERAVCEHNKISSENIRITIHDPILLTNELVYKINHGVVNTHSERRFRMSCTAKVSFCAYYRGEIT